jgi:soluble lytic murein transglycosylase-like protein
VTSPPASLAATVARLARSLAAAAAVLALSAAGPATASSTSLGESAAKPAGQAAPDAGLPATAPATPGSSASAAEREGFRAIARREALARGLPPEMADAVMRVESAYRADARGAAGEIGLMQVMPPTARMLGFSGTLDELAEPQANIALGVRYLAEAWRLAGGDICTATMKYRAGHNETRFSVLSVRYCERVRAHLASVGYPVTGAVPPATFGFRADTTRMGIAIGTQQAARRLASGRKLRSRVGWAEHDARMKALIARGRVGL